MIQQIGQSPVSLAHIGFAVVALLSGTLVVWQPKGTAAHRRVGYVYVGSMVVVLATAFGIYRLFGRFGVVHWGAIVSVLLLLVGVGTARFRAYLRQWLLWHYLAMSGSVTGLYATFLVESTYRLFPPQLFWWATVGLSMVVFGVAGCVIYRHLNHLYLPEMTRETSVSPVIEKLSV